MLTKLEIDLASLSKQYDTKSTILAKDIGNILVNVKKQPVTIITKDGRCVPSPTFVDSIRQAINRANQK